MKSKSQLYSNQVAFLTKVLDELARKAKLKKTPELYISKHERLASVNVFQNRISVGEHLLYLWAEGKFSESDVEATLAHEIGHLMDFRRDSKSSSFRNLLAESLWIAFGILPIVLYLLSPSIQTLVLSALLAIGWGFSLPFIVRWVEVRIELAADRNAAIHLVNPQQLADALVKISSFGMPPTTLGLTAKLSFLAGTLTHPSFSDRVRFLQNL
ncbi:MAG: M48 family metalloprotease [Candidatus Bathyarchaeota archaeon]|nr:M48 family metalloprotease [Candidatus Bathyarchaeota archaeon]